MNNNNKSLDKFKELIDKSLKKAGIYRNANIVNNLREQDPAVWNLDLDIDTKKMLADKVVKTLTKKKKEGFGIRKKITYLRIVYGLYKIYKQIKENGMKVLSSKKFLALTTGILMLILVNLLGFGEAEASKIVDAITVILSAFFIGQGVADGLSKGVTSGVANGKEKGADDK